MKFKHIMGWSLLTSSLWAGPYPPAAGQTGSDAIASTSAVFKSWATTVTSLVRGKEQIVQAPDDEDPPFPTLASYGTASSALGLSDAAEMAPDPDGTAPRPTVSLGDGGSITLSFSKPVTNGPGADFAVFENGFRPPGGLSVFLELAFVEVSSDGATFVRFPAHSLTPTTRQMSNGDTLDATNLKNLAGKYRAGFGTPFDLGELAGHSSLDLNRITHVRIIDVVGCINPTTAGSRDSQNRLINDPWPTPYESSGFDLDAVGVINEAVTTTPDDARTYAAWVAAISWPVGASTDRLADPDADGLSNWEEYVFLTSPVQANRQTQLQITHRPDQQWEALMSWRHLATDITARWESRETTGSWQPLSLVTTSPSSALITPSSLRLLRFNATAQ